MRWLLLLLVFLAPGCLGDASTAGEHGSAGSLLETREAQPMVGRVPACEPTTGVNCRTLPPVALDLPYDDALRAAYLTMDASETVTGLEDGELTWQLHAATRDRLGEIVVGDLLASATGWPELALNLTGLTLGPGETLVNNVTFHGSRTVIDHIYYTIHGTIAVERILEATALIQSERFEARFNGTSVPCLVAVDPSCNSCCAGVHFDGGFQGKMTNFSATISWAATTPASDQMRVYVVCTTDASTTCGPRSYFRETGTSPIVIERDWFPETHWGGHLHIEAAPAGPDLWVSPPQDYRLDVSWTDTFASLDGRRG